MKASQPHLRLTHHSRLVVARRIASERLTSALGKGPDKLLACNKLDQNTVGMAAPHADHVPAAAFGIGHRCSCLLRVGVPSCGMAAFPFL